VAYSQPKSSRAKRNEKRRGRANH